MISWFDECDYEALFPGKEFIWTKGKNGGVNVLHLPLSFDIETTTIGEKAYMYTWQMGVDCDVNTGISEHCIRGTKWTEFIELLEFIEKRYGLNESRRIVIWIANLSFEFQFMRKWLNITNLFASENRQPLKAIHNYCIEFRDALMISGGSLESLANMYGTSHRKLSGDLDYNVIRNSKDAKHMRSMEDEYCVNDVLILTEFSELMFKQYIIPKHIIPLTKTGLLRSLIKEGLHGNIGRVKNGISSIMPHDWDMYIFVMQYLFRGGYNHASCTEIGVVSGDVLSADKTSSYPWSMCTYTKYPMSNFIPKEWNNDNLEKYAMWGVFTFTNIRSKTKHSIESRSKCIALKNPIIDNGRVDRADIMTVALTDLDWDTYLKFYEWDSVTIERSYGAKYGRLPSYLINPMMELYSLKNKLKLQGKSDSIEYAITKSQVNSFYGMCVTKIHDKNIVYSDDEWKVEYKDDYWKERNNQFLSPYWGIWICSISRHDLLKSVHGMCEYNVYCDTDSTYFHEYDGYKDYFNSINMNIRKGVIDAINHYKLDYDTVIGLGEYEFENMGKKYKHFKTLGCKRYIKETEKGVKTTIAGLPKSYFKGQSWNDIESQFNDSMVVKDCKLRSVYNDDEHSDIVNDELMYEKSSVALVPTDFTLSLDTLWVEVLEQCLKNTYH